jgi:enoyl-CoA hydratase/carnithine racemase
MAPVPKVPAFSTSPPSTKYCILSYPTPEILVVTLNRPRQLNCISGEGNEELDAVWKWLDAEPKLCVGILTGTGRAFCAGADLKGMSRRNHHDALTDMKYQNGIKQTHLANSVRCHRAGLVDCHAVMDASQS